MSTKTQIQTLIDTVLASEGGISGADVRNVLKDSADSILENIYPTPLVDSDATETYLDLTNADDPNATFSVTITKNGRWVDINGTYTTAVGNVNSLFEIKTGTYPELEPPQETPQVLPGSCVCGSGIYLNSDTLEMLQVVNIAGTTRVQLTNLRLMPALETLEFHIRYFTDL